MSSNLFAHILQPNSTHKHTKTNTSTPLPILYLLLLGPKPTLPLLCHAGTGNFTSSGSSLPAGFGFYSARWRQWGERGRQARRGERLLLCLGAIPATALCPGSGSCFQPPFSFGTAPPEPASPAPRQCPFSELSPCFVGPHVSFLGACYNRLPQVGWLKITEIYSLIFWKLEV